jgi:hypothetical protein
MKKLCSLLLVLAIVVAGVGFYRGWFALSGSRHTDSNKVNINLRVDPDKVKEDAETVKEKSSELTGKVADEANELGHEAKEELKSDRE